MTSPDPRASAWWLPACRDGAARQAGKPAPTWVSLVEQALARAPRTGRAPDRRRDPQRRLGHPLRPFLTVTRDRIAERTAALGTGEQSALVAGALDRLAARHLHLAGRTLVAELGTARKAGTLRGADSAARFDDFLRATSARAALTGLLRRYPVLARLLAEACENTVTMAAELAGRLAADRAALADRFGLAHARLTRARFVGDRHAGGRSVAVLTFTGGARVVYRPRPVDLHASWNALVDWFRVRYDGPAPRTVDVLARPGYGWVEFAPARPCRSPEQVRRFYQRLGALLALLHAVDATDVHCENVIASGGHPVLVDVETLLHPSWQPCTDGPADPAWDALAASVLRTAVLPRPQAGRYGILDLSAFGGRRDATYPDDLPGWADPGTDRMRLVHGPQPYPGGRNRPVLDGHEVEPRRYRDCLLAGFRAAYRTLVEHAGDLTAPGGPLAGFVGCDARVVARPSQWYAALLAEATEPETLRDLADRERAFGALRAPSGYPHHAQVADAELADLMADQLPLFTARVPLFTARGDEPRLRDATGRPVPGVPTGAGLAAARAKVAGFGPADLAEQEWFARAALASGARGHHDAGRPAAPAPRRLVGRWSLLTLAAAIGDELVARSYQNTERVNWLGLECDRDVWSVRPAGAGLADGYCGIALFLAELGRVSGVRRHLELARRAVRPLPLLVRRLATHRVLAEAVGPGFHGLGGVGYAVARLADLLDDDELTGCLPDALAAIATAASADGVPVSVADGLAGAALAARAVHRQSGLTAAAELHLMLSGRLRAAAPDEPAEPGFLWGAAGVAYALGCRRVDTPAGTDLSWCAGAAGALLPTWCAASSPAADPDAVADLLEAIRQPRPLADHCLCHGELGVLDVLLAGRDDERVAGTLDEASSRLLASVERYGPLCGTPDAIPTPGLLTGLAGIGYGLLRLGYPDRIPSVLLLEPANRQ